MEMSRTQPEGREPASSSSPSVVDINPPAILVFDGHGMVNRTISTILHIKNITDSVVIFKIKTTRPKAYCVRPNSGHLMAGEAISVEVTMQSFENVEQDLSKHKFQVQAACVPSVPDDVAAAWADIDKHKIAPVQDAKLKCAVKNLLLSPMSSKPVTLGLTASEPTPARDTSAAAAGTTQRRQEANARKLESTPVKSAAEPNKNEDVVSSTRSQPEATSAQPSSRKSSAVTSAPTATAATKPSSEHHVSTVATTHEDVAGTKGSMASMWLLLIAFILGVVIGRFVL
eukprot:m.28410 g.28410  ORF g.28410 m.28410 type:complete len:286 (-) comp10444_c0_seq2:55-912(-)